MQKSLMLVGTSLILMLSDGAYAHNGLFAHPEIASEPAHFLVHALMMLPFAIGVFFLSRWLIRRNQR